MFTGIVEALGTVTAVESGAESARLGVRAPVLIGTALGDSVAVNGVCLTAVEVIADAIVADVMAETLRWTALAGLRKGDPVNIERAVTPTTRLGGHLVQGHVDGIGRVTGRVPGEAWVSVTVELPAGLSRYVVDKGSIALDGVSLTVASVDGDAVTVGLIPETLQRTTWGSRQVGDAVNVEVDVLAKYVERLLEARQEQG